MASRQSKLQIASVPHFIEMLHGHRVQWQMMLALSLIHRLTLVALTPIAAKRNVQAVLMNPVTRPKTFCDMP